MPLLAFIQKIRQVSADRKYNVWDSGLWLKRLNSSLLTRKEETSKKAHLVQTLVFRRDHK